MDKFSYHTGINIPIAELGLELHQPSLKEISYLQTDIAFYSAIRVLGLRKEKFVQKKEILDQINNFQVFSAVLEEKENHDIKQNVVLLLSILFPNRNVVISPLGGIILLDAETSESVVIDEKNFELLQTEVRNIFRMDSKFMGGDGKEFNAANAQAQAIIDKIKRGRERIAAQRESGEESILGKYVSIISVVLGIDIMDVLEWTLPMLYEQIERYKLLLNWNIDLKARLAGADPKTHPDDFMKDIV